MSAENDAAKLARWRTELAQARATRDRLEVNGQSASFGGVNFSGVQYEQILKRISKAIEKHSSGIWISKLEACLRTI